MVRGARLKVYAGAPHATAAAHKEKLNAYLEAFLKIEEA
jgi:hypothetical protein